MGQFGGDVLYSFHAILVWEILFGGHVVWEILYGGNRFFNSTASPCVIV